MNLSQASKLVRMKPDGTNFVGAAGMTAINSDIIDMAGFENVRFTIAMGTIAAGAVTSVKIQQNDANSGTGMEDLTGSSVTVADDKDNQLIVIDVLKPKKRYLRVVTSRATANATVDAMIADLYDARVQPVTKDATVLSQTVLASP